MNACPALVRSPEEILERNRLQIEDCQQHYCFACLVEGKELTQSELLHWYVRMGFAKMFEVEWREGQNPDNVWYTGVRVQHPPTRIDAWCHYREYLISIELRVMI